eukprot:CAMPEP_0197040400 /NCGR_PEP_ID=MMETSP1384-20130603/17104_1 /TAXON_ID=29189 /ORGANISM="Ammonia sp." /LENGTH=284 /DNA_ID=CAMNT_0042471147 /DNA_START=190 /DNA_END=1044 /DNA_ORIENTATION=+
MYALSRLQYVTSHKFSKQLSEAQFASTSISYSKYWFTVLYWLGAPRFAYTFLTSIYITLDVEFYEFTDNDDFGCYGDIFTSRMRWKALATPGVTTYLMWDWTIAALYVFKLISLKRKVREISDSQRHNQQPGACALNNQQLEIQAMRRVIADLAKVLSLTAISKLYPMVHLPTLYDAEENALWLAWDQSVGTVVENAFIFTSVYLINTHNEKDYRLVLRPTRKLACCCGEPRPGSDLLSGAPAEQLVAESIEHRAANQPEAGGSGGAESEAASGMVELQVMDRE